MPRSTYIITVGKVLSANSEARLLTVDLGQRIVNVNVPQENGIYFPQANDLIEIESNGHNLIYKSTLLYNSAQTSGEYRLNCSQWNVTKNGAAMFSIFSPGYTD